jgi:hypothetical protein
LQAEKKSKEDKAFSFFSFGKSKEEKKAKEEKLKQEKEEAELKAAEKKAQEEIEIKAKEVTKHYLEIHHR